MYKSTAFTTLSAVAGVLLWGGGSVHAVPVPGGTLDPLTIPKYVTPGEITSIAANFDLNGLYVWHCHIVEHEDKEMMVPMCVGEAGVDCPSSLF